MKNWEIRINGATFAVFDNEAEAVRVLERLRSKRRRLKIKGDRITLRTAVLA